MKTKHTLIILVTGMFIEIIVIILFLYKLLTHKKTQGFFKLLKQQ